MLGTKITKIIWETTNVPLIHRITENCDTLKQQQSINDKLVDPAHMMISSFEPNLSTLD